MDINLSINFLYARKTIEMFFLFYFSKYYVTRVVMYAKSQCKSMSHLTQPSIPAAKINLILCISKFLLNAIHYNYCNTCLCAYCCCCWVGFYIYIFFFFVLFLARFLLLKTTAVNVIVCNKQLCITLAYNKLVCI